MNRFYCAGCNGYVNRVEGRVTIAVEVEIWHNHSFSIDSFGIEMEHLIPGSLICLKCGESVEMRKGKWVFVENEGSNE